MEKIRIVVTGSAGQMAQSLSEKASKHTGIEVISLGRPQLDLAITERIAECVSATSPDILVSAAAYTAVDAAEADPETAFAVNSRAPGELARVASKLRIPLIHLSTDYVFDGTKSSPYLESDYPIPLNVYGRSKLAGEESIAAGTDNHVILRTAWLYSPFGKNFVRTILRRAETERELAVVADQVGNPTSALDLATAIFKIAKNLLDSKDPGLRGTFHLTGAGEASWADFGEAVFEVSKGIGGPRANITRISSSDYETLVARPMNSRLCCKLAQDRHGVVLPNWNTSIEEVICRSIKTLNTGVKTR